MATEVHVAGRVTDASNKKRLAWRLLGIFSTEKLAIKACTTIKDFVRRFDLDVPIEDQGAKLSTVWFPLKKEKK